MIKSNRTFLILKLSGSLSFFIKFTLFFIILFCQSIFAQLLLQGFAPLAPGNYWKYRISLDGTTVSDSLSFLVKDSIVTINGREYYVVLGKSVSDTGYRYLGISADSFYIRYNESGEDSIYKYLKYNCQLGDSWGQFYSTSYIIFSVIDTFTINAWGTYYNAKEIHLTDYGLLSLYQLWTDSLGLMSEFSEAQYAAGLAGCVINGKLYGDTAMYVTSVNEKIKPVNEFILSQNYPNPFNPSTTISYYIPHTANVKLKIYNILAEEVATLVDDFQYPGYHRVKFNGKGFASGVYIQV
jgi:hypothetical protein